jgi:Na+-transporting NADH:ubiquinone oxidoreductase subunit B
LRKFFDSRRSGARARADHGVISTLGALIDQFAYSAPGATVGKVHVRDGVNTQRLLNSFVVASLPCWLIGTWNLGVQTHVAMLAFGLDGAPGWRGQVMTWLGAGYDPTDVLSCFLHGLLYFLPLFTVALATGVLWEAVFASQRRRPVDHGALSIAWIFALIVPATLASWQVALGMSFAMIVGKGIFGGTGRYLVNPAILGFAFLVFSYTTVIHGEGAWIPVAGYDEPTTIQLAVEEGGVAALTSVGYRWSELFFGLQPGPVGVTSAFGCLLGAVYLVLAGVASLRIMLGSLIGMIATVSLLNALGPTENPMFAVPWFWHAVIGGWAFGTVFIATDPVAAATTEPGRWAFGILVGALTIIVRVTNPAYYEGVMFAILLASVFAPLIDFVVVERNIRRRRQRLEAAGDA